MAKVNVMYDTIAKECSVSVDGKQVENLMACDVYYDYYKSENDGKPKFALSITTMTEDKENKTVKHEYIRASVAKSQEPEETIAAVREKLSQYFEQATFSSAYQKEDK